MKHLVSIQGFVILALVIFGIAHGDFTPPPKAQAPDFGTFDTFYIAVVRTGEGNCPVAVEVFLLDTINDASVIIGQMYIDSLWWMNDTPEAIDGRVFLDLDANFDTQND